MAVVTVQDILDRAQQFEQLLADYYANVSKHADREGVRLLTDYMSRHRERILAALEKLSAERIHRICSAPLRYEPQAADCRCFEGMDLSKDATAGQVLDAAVTFDECLVSLYRQVLQQPVDQEVTALVGGFLRAEQRDEIELKKIKAMDYF